MVMKRKIVLIIGITALLFWGWKLYSNSQIPQKPKTPQIVLDKTDEKLTLSGIIDTQTKAVIKFPVGGKIIWEGASDGDRVKKWQALASLDPSSLQTAVTSAYYKYLASDANAKQIEDEVKGHDNDETFVQKNKRVTAQITRDSAYESWLQAKRDLANTTIYSPIDGIIIAKVANSTQTEFTIVDPKSIYFSASADQSEVGLLSIGQTGTLILDAFPNASVSGTITNIGFLPKVGETGTVYEVKFKIVPNEKYRLGMTGDISFDTPPHD